MPQFYCMHCGQHIDADNDLIGQSAECPTCRHIITIPSDRLQRTSRIQRISSASPPPPPPPLHSRNQSVVDWDRFRINCLKAASFAVCLGVFHAWFRPKTSLEMYMPSSQLGVLGFVLEAVGWLLGAVIFSFVVSLIAALVLSAFKRPFVSTLTDAFPIGIAGIAALAYLSLFLK
ncbi:MAG: hypothetical protein ABL974_05400 [Prosthecobacter sp.]